MQPPSPACILDRVKARRGLIAAIAVMAVWLGAAPGAALAAGVDVEEAQAALRAGEYEDAIELFEPLLEEAETEVAARIGRARCRMALGRHDEALAELRKSPSFEDSAELLAVAGETRLRVGQHAAAHKFFEAAVANDSASAHALYYLGESQRRMGDLDAARETFNRSIDVYRALSFEAAEALPPSAFVYWGLALVGLNRFNDAHRIMFSQAEEKDPRDPLLLLVWGEVMAQKYNFPDSRSFYRDALADNPRYTDALVAMADNYLQDFQVGTKRFDLAQRSIDRALDIDPGHAGAHAAQGWIWFYDGRCDRAQESFEKSLERNPADLRVLGLVATCHFLTGDRKSFAEVEERALKINPRGAEFYHTIASNIDKKFQYPHCVTFCDRALELDPDYWPAYVTLGINCLRTGDEKRGREFLEKSWQKDRFNPWVYNTRLFLKHIDENYVSFKDDNLEIYLPREDASILRPYLQPLMEESLRVLGKRYRVDIEVPIRVESFARHKWFSARTVGLEGFAASGACFGRLVTLTSPRALPQNWGAVAWHEFAHVATLQKSDFRVPRWLTEGISVYEEGLDREHWTRRFGREIADAWASGRISGIGALDHGFSKPKFPGQVLLSYYQGSLVVEFITEKWGFDAVLELLDGYDAYRTTAEIFQDVLDRELAQFDEEFDAWLQKWIEAGGYTPRPSEDTLPGLELAVEADPDNEDLLVRLAWAYLANGNDVDGQLKVQELLEKAPESGDAHALQGFAHLQAKKTSDAKDSLASAVELGTRFEYRAHAYLGDLHARERESEKAIEHYELAKKASPATGAAYPAGGNNIYYKLHELYQAAGRDEKALEQMVEVAKYSPEDGKCRLEIVKDALRRQDAETAAKYLEEMMYINPFDMQLHRWLAQAAEELGRHETVIRETKILLTDPDTNKLKAHFSLAKAYLGAGDAEAAEREASRVLQIDSAHDGAREVIEKARAAREEAEDKAAKSKAPEGGAESDEESGERSDRKPGEASSSPAESEAAPVGEPG